MLDLTLIFSLIKTYSLRAELREELDINKMRHKYFMVRARKELFKKGKQQAKIRQPQTKICQSQHVGSPTSTLRILEFWLD